MRRSLAKAYCRSRMESPAHRLRSGIPHRRVTALLFALALVLALGAAQAGTGAALPSGRAYEMVSPLDKNGGDVDRDFLLAQGGPVSQSGASPSGAAVAYTSRLQIGDIESGPLRPTYVARRGATGWTTEGVTPPIANNTQATAPDFPSVFALSPDLSKAYVRSSAVLTADAALLNGSWGLYMRSSGQPQPYTLLSRPWQELGADTSQLRFHYAAATPDSRHVVFNSGRRLLPDAPADSSFSNAVYEWVDGSLTLASVPPPGVSFTGQTAWAGSDRINVGTRNGEHVISDDGRRIFFTAATQTAANQLFVREDGATTLAVSASERPGDPPLAPAGNPRFWAAKSTDGSVAFFTSNSPLTEGAGTSSLYRWDANAPEGQRLTELTHDASGGTSGVAQIVVRGAAAAVTDDATSVAFVASGELAPGASPSGQKLYLWRQGEGVRYVANIDASLDRTLSSMLLDGGGSAARLSADGERLLFASYAHQPQLDPAYDTVEESAEDCGDAAVAGDRCRQIYLYDAPSDELSCLTCVPGVAVSGDANLFGNGDQRRPPQGGSSSGVTPPVQLPRNLSADGTRAFFETARPLVSGDENTKLDVYEWEDPDLDGQGELRLISPGRGTSDSKFLDASASGDNVFFTTREQLVGIDSDNQVDLYDARVGGGIAAQNPPPVLQCEADQCQGALSSAPFLPGIGSGGASHGNLDLGPRPTFSVARLSREQRAQLARGRQVLVRVRTNRAGKVRLAARAELGRRMRTVDTASKAARKAGRVTLGVKLSRAAVRELARKRKLKVTLAVRFTGVREAQTSTVSLRRARGAGERRPR
jgi:hypothetical protein